MRTSHRLIIVIACCAIALSACCALAQDWSQWRGEDRDAKVAGFSTPAVWPPALTATWTAVVGTGDATPALVGDRLYVFARQADEEVALCLNATDGTELWRDSYAEEAPSGAAGRHPGPRSSPAVGDGMMVTLGVRGVVSCLNAETGDVVWRKDPFPDAVPKFFTSMSPIIVDGVAVVHLGSEDNGALVALDLAAGEEKWRWDGAGPQYASPVLLSAGDTRQIVTMTANSVVGVSATDGALLWQLPFEPQSRAYNAATPIVDGQTVIYTGAGRGTSAVRIVAQDGGFGVEEVWKNPDIAVQYNSPVLENGLLFGLSSDGNLFCLDAQTGETKWVGDEQLGRGGFGTIVSTGSALFALPSSGELIAYEPTGEAYTELGRFTVSDTATYAYPVLSGNRIFIENQETVTLWTIQ